MGSAVEKEPTTVPGPLPLATAVPLKVSADGSLRTVTVKVWADAGRTQAAIATALPVTLRLRPSWKRPDGFEPPELYHEELKTYFVSGSTAVIQTDWVTQYVDARAGYIPDTGVTRILFALDPGEDYNIIRP